jgi:Na+-driven multidrug efflux pump
MIWDQTIWPVIGYLFHPSYMLVNAVILGKLPKIYLAAFGIGSSTIGIVLFATGVCYVLALNNVVPQAFG